MKVKKIIVFLIILISIISISLISNAGWLDEFDGSTTVVGATDRVEDTLGVVLGVIQVIAMAVATIMLIVLGMKYMVASASDRAEIKKHAIVYVTGAILMFGASGILEIIKDFAIDIGA